MSAFTTLSSGGNAQSLAMANEIVLAYSERSQAIGGSAVSALSAGDNAQDKSLWSAMQNWLEANCTSFIDHVNGPLNPAETDFLYFTLATWQAEAGLNVSAVDGESFRRKLNPSDADSYSHIATGDCRGDWVFEDLQKGFGMLRWTLPNVNYTMLSSQHGYSDGLASYALASVAAWADRVNHSSVYGVPGEHFQIYDEGGASWDADCDFYRGEANEPLVIPGISRDKELYLYARAYNFSPLPLYFNDFDAGLIQDAWNEIASPYIVPPLDWSADWPPVATTGWGWTSTSNKWLLKWDFTNA